MSVGLNLIYHSVMDVFHWIKYCEKTYEREGINYFWCIKNSTEILNKLKTKGFQASTISTYDFIFLRFILRYHII